MAASLRRFRVFYNLRNYIPKREYSIQPPIWLGGRPFRKGQYEVGVPEEDNRSLEERLAELNPFDPELDERSNIGDEYKVRTSRREWVRLAQNNKNNPQLEQAARHRKLSLPLDKVKADWLAEYGPLHVQELAEHYGIYRDLFDNALFTPSLPVTICYEYDEEYVTPVYRGNHINPSEAATEPIVEYEAPEDSLWTLIMTNPDGHLTDNNAEYLHWFVGNIPGDDISKGEVICDYLRPFPPHGTGLHRHIFVMFRQNKHIDYSKEKRPPQCKNLKERTFRTEDFYRQYEDIVTPVGLNWYQSEWDESVRDVYHNILGMREVRFEYDHPPSYRAPLRRYPHKEPFDRYYDRYRHRKDIAEEVLKMKLKLISPFAPYTPELKYPIVHRAKDYKPQWLKRREELMHRRVEQFTDLPR